MSSTRIRVSPKPAMYRVAITTPSGEAIATDRYISVLASRNELKSISGMRTILLPPGHDLNPVG